MLSRIRRRIILKFLTVTILLGLSLDALVLALYYPYRHQELIGEMSAVIGVVATKLDPQLSAAAQGADRARGRQLLSLFAAFPYSVCADFRTEATQPPAAFWPIPCEKMADRGRALTIPSVSSPGGLISVILSDSEIQTIMLREFSLLLGLGLAIGTALMASVGLVFNLVINRPLRRLVNAMHLFETQNIYEKVRWTSQDELGQVAYRYNTMLETELARVQEINAQRAKVQALEERTRSIINNAADGVIVIDQRGRIELFSPAAEAIFGYTAADVVGNNVSMLMPANNAEQHDHFIADFVDHRPSRSLTRNREVQGRRQDGSLFPMDLAIGEMVIGEDLYFTGIIRDITERHRAAAQLRDAYEVITTSISYASNIQRAILPDEQVFNQAFPEHIILWEPRDLVGGDFYHFARWGDGFLVALADCTGHGVPGAFMTLIAKSALENAQADVPPGDLGGLMHLVNRRVQSILGQDEADGPSDDGLEMGVCYLPDAGKDLLYAGARFPLFITQAGKTNILKGSRAAMGYRRVPADQHYQVDQVPLDPGTMVYLTTDGLLDQIGGPRQRMFGKKRFVALLDSLSDLSMSDQRDRIADALSDYQGKAIRRDDVSVIGFRVPDQKANRQRRTEVKPTTTEHSGNV